MDIPYYTRLLDNWLHSVLGDGSSEAWADLLGCLVVALTAAVAYFVVLGALGLIHRAASRTQTKWDDDFVEPRQIRAISQLVPAIVVNCFLPALFVGQPRLHFWAAALTQLYIVWAVVHIFNVFFTNLYNALARRRRTRAYAIKGIFQMFKLITIGIGVIVGISILIQRSPVTILTALGASAAVLMLVFKDTILGLVASIQLSANKMVHRGDWIVCKSHNADGEVIDVSLTTVKVRNWDNSVSTIPPYSLVSESFRNYQAMRVSGGRRVERSILIDLNTVRHLSEAEISALKEKGLMPEQGVSTYINLHLLRLWLENFLATDPRVKTDMLHMVRQMEPTAQGVPLQLYFFTTEVEWKPFEVVQSDIMDQVYATVNAFGLRMFQAPAGTDLQRALKG